MKVSNSHMNQAGYRPTHRTSQWTPSPPHRSATPACAQLSSQLRGSPSSTIEASHASTSPKALGTLAHGRRTRPVRNADQPPPSPLRPCRLAAVPGRACHVHRGPGEGIVLSACARSQPPDAGVRPAVAWQPGSFRTLEGNVPSAPPGPPGPPHILRDGARNRILARSRASTTPRAVHSWGRSRMRRQPCEVVAGGLPVGCPARRHRSWPSASLSQRTRSWASSSAACAVG